MSKAPTQTLIALTLLIIILAAVWVLLPHTTTICLDCNMPPLKGT